MQPTTLSPHPIPRPDGDMPWPAASHMDWLSVMCSRPLRAGEPPAVDGELVAAPWDEHVRRFVAGARLEMEFRIDNLNRSLDRWKRLGCDLGRAAERAVDTSLLSRQVSACRACMVCLDAWTAHPNPIHLQRAAACHERDARLRRAWLVELKRAACRPVAC